MDEATRERVRELLGKPLGELTVGEAIFLGLTLDQAGDDELAELVGL